MISFPWPTCPQNHPHRTPKQTPRVQINLLPNVLEPVLDTVIGTILHMPIYRNDATIFLTLYPKVQSGISPEV